MILVNPHTGKRYSKNVWEDETSVITQQRHKQVCTITYNVGINGHFTLNSSLNNFSEQLVLSAFIGGYQVDKVCFLIVKYLF